MAEQNDALDFSIFDIPEGQDPLKMAAPGEKEEVSEPEPEEVSQNDDNREAAIEEELKGAQEEQKESAEPAKGEPKKVEVSDDDMVPILQDGKVEWVRWGDHKGYVMRQADYTRKTTRVAERERELEGFATTLQQREEKLLDIFADKAKLDQLYIKLYGAPPAAAAAKEEPPAASPDELVTRGDADKMKGEVLTEAQKAAQAVVREELKRVQEAQEHLAAQQFANSLRSTVEESLDGVLKDHAEQLGDIPHVDVLIRKLAWEEHQPKTLDEVKAAIVAAGQKLAEQFAARNREQKKVEAVKKASLEKGIESGGTPPGRPKKSYETKDGRTDWDSLDRDVLNWIEARTKR